MSKGKISEEEDKKRGVEETEIKAHGLEVKTLPHKVTSKLKVSPLTLKSDWILRGNVKGRGERLKDKWVYISVSLIFRDFNFQICY